MQLIPLAFAAASAAIPFQVGSTSTSSPAKEATQRNVTISRPADSKDRKPIHYELLDDHVVFKAILNGVEVWALLDNRATQSLVSRGFASLNGLVDVDNTGTLRAVASARPIARSKPISVTFPGQMNFTSPFMIADLSGIALSTRRTIDVVIGRDYFYGLGYSFNPTNKVFSVGLSGSAHPSAPYQRYDIQLSRPKLNVNVNGQILALTIDLGLSDGVALSATAWARIPVTPRRRGMEVVDVNGNISTAQTDALADVKIGNITFSSVDVCNCPVLTEDGDGLIGMGVLKRVPFVLDEKAGTVWIAPPPVVSGPAL